MQTPRPPDYHVHTPLCKHATGSVWDYIKEAEKKGIKEICFSDHMPSNGIYDPKHRMGLEQFQEYLDTIQGAKEASPIRVLLGIEADYYEGCEAFLERILRSADFDLVLGSVHFLDGWGFDDPEQLPVWELVDVNETWVRYFQLLKRLVNTGLFDVVAHLDLPKKFGHRIPKEMLKELAAPLLDLMAEKGVAMEINTSGLRRPVSELYPCVEILHMAKERGIPICFGSDAHEPEMVGYAFLDALEVAKEVGFERHAVFRNRKMSFHPLP